MSEHEKRLKLFKEREAALAKGLPWPPKLDPASVRKRAAAKKRKAAKVVEIPLEYLLVYYEEIRQANPTGFSVQPIPFTEILAYVTLYRIPWDAFDIETIRRLDVVWLNCLPKHDPKDKSKG